MIVTTSVSTELTNFYETRVGWRHFLLSRLILILRAGNQSIAIQMSLRAEWLDHFERSTLVRLPIDSLAADPSSSIYWHDELSCAYTYHNKKTDKHENCSRRISTSITRRRKSGKALKEPIRKEMIFGIRRRFDSDLLRRWYEVEYHHRSSNRDTREFDIVLQQWRRTCVRGNIHRWRVSWEN